MLNSTPYNYTVSFEAPLVAGDSRSPEQLARAIFEGASQPVRWFLVVGWRFVVGLRLGPRSSPEHVLGWRIVGRDPDSVTLGLASSFLTARLVVRTDRSRVTHSTYVLYDRPIAAVIWPPVSVLHRQIVPRLLRRATRSTLVEPVAVSEARAVVEGEEGGPAAEVKTG